MLRKTEEHAERIREIRNQSKAVPLVLHLITLGASVWVYLPLVGDYFYRRGGPILLAQTYHIKTSHATIR
jgi:hypothetical protein